MVPAQVGVVQMIMVLHRGGTANDYGQMITILFRGGGVSQDPQKVIT